MCYSQHVECSQCGVELNLFNLKENDDYTTEVHDGETCFFCESCNDGDWGLVKCGKCGKELRRHEAFLNEKYLYLCNDCEE